MENFNDRMLVEKPGKILKYMKERYVETRN